MLTVHNCVECNPSVAGESVSDVAALASRPYWLVARNFTHADVMSERSEY